MDYIQLMPIENLHFETGGHPVHFSFREICIQNNIIAPRIFWFKMPKLPSAFMLNNQNIKQKPIPSCTYLSYVLSQCTPIFLFDANSENQTSIELKFKCLRLRQIY